MIIAQVIILLFILPLAYGPVGHFLSLGHGGPDLFLVATWLFAWLTDQETALRWAIMAGLTIDLLNFQFFGFWTAQFVAVALAIDYLRGRHFQVSSLLEAVLTLLASTLLSLALQTIVARQFELIVWLNTTIANVVLGIILYYVLVVRFRLFQRWMGQRL